MFIQTCIHVLWQIFLHALTSLDTFKNLDYLFVFQRVITVFPIASTIQYAFGSHIGEVMRQQRLFALQFFAQLRYVHLFFFRKQRNDA